MIPVNVKRSRFDADHGLGGGAFRTGAGGCRAGRGVKGGKSTGPGSGRYRLWQCECTPPIKARVASDDFDATCNKCSKVFACVHGGGAGANLPGSVEREGSLTWTPTEPC